MEAIHQQLIALLFIITGLLFTPLVFIALDYWAGIRKAKKRGEKIISNKMKRTLDKISRYYNAILAMLVLDTIQIAGFIFLYLFFSWKPYTFPAFTMLAVLFTAFIEIKSIYEPADAKESKQMKEVTELAKSIVENRDSPEKIAEILSTYLNRK